MRSHCAEDTKAEDLWCWDVPPPSHLHFGGFDEAPGTIAPLRFHSYATNAVLKKCCI